MAFYAEINENAGIIRVWAKPAWKGPIFCSGVIWTGTIAEARDFAEAILSVLRERNKKK